MARGIYPLTKYKTIHDQKTTVPNRRQQQKKTDSLYSSKLRCGFPHFGKIRWYEEDVTTQEFGDLQKDQNKMLRLINKSSIYDKIPTSSILSKHYLLSVNQTNAQMKLLDMWKANKE